MKNLSLVILTLCGITAGAQSFTPRTGVNAWNDKTFQAMTISYVNVTDHPGEDTVKLNLNAYRTLVSLPALVDSIDIAFPSVTSCYLGDEVTFTITNTATGTAVKFTGNNLSMATPHSSWPPGTSLYLTPSLRANITFIFDGSAWIEQNRMIQ
jgi:hypothetical protein